MPVLVSDDQPRGIPAASVLTDRDPKHYVPGCDHEDSYLRVLSLGTGANQYRFQCLTCGRKGNAIRHDHWLIASLKSDPPEIDPDLETQWWKAQQEERLRERDAKNAEWWGWYTAYLQTVEWRNRAEKVLRRDRWACQADLDGCDHRATQVHHLTYDHVGSEPLFDLIAICGSCHEQLTQMDRSRRQAAA